MQGVDPPALKSEKTFHKSSKGLSVDWELPNRYELFLFKAILEKLPSIFFGTIFRAASPPHLLPHVFHLFFGVREGHH